MPGSTLKVLTTESLWTPARSPWTPNSAPSRMGATADINPIQNSDGTNCGGNLREVFRRSCNIPFAQTRSTSAFPG